MREASQEWGFPRPPEGRDLLPRRVGAGVPVGTAFLPRLRGRRGERRDKISPGAWPSPRRGPGGATPAPGVRVLPKVAGAVQEALEPAERLRGLPTADPQGVPGVAAQGVEVPFPQAQVSPQEATPAELLTLAILLPLLHLAPWNIAFG
jgi:hypothetical protein